MVWSLHKLKCKLSEAASCSFQIRHVSWACWHIHRLQSIKQESKFTLVSFYPSQARTSRRWENSQRPNNLIDLQRRASAQINVTQHTQSWRSLPDGLTSDNHHSQLVTRSYASMQRSGRAAGERKMRWRDGAELRGSAWIIISFHLLLNFIEEAAEFSNKCWNLLEDSRHNQLVSLSLKAPKHTALKDTCIYSRMRHSCSRQWVDACFLMCNDTERKYNSYRKTAPNKMFDLE